MGLFDFMKKKKTEEAIIKPQEVQVAFVTEEKLTEEGELPWGWVSRNKNFTDKIEKEYTYFLNKWINSRNASPKERYEALKSFVLYLQDVEKLCQQKGECFVFWYEEILTGSNYLEKREKELKQLEQNFDAEAEKYKNTQEELQYKKMRIPQLKPEVISKLKDNPGVLQSDFWKMFDAKDKDSVSDIVYALVKSGIIEREKSGRSFILFYKG